MNSSTYGTYNTGSCSGPMPDDIEIQTMLGEAINRLIKHHHKSLRERVGSDYRYRYSSYC